MNVVGDIAGAACAGLLGRLWPAEDLQVRSAERADLAASATPRAEETPGPASGVDAGPEPHPTTANSR